MNAKRLLSAALLGAVLWMMAAPRTEAQQVESRLADTETPANPAAAAAHPADAPLPSVKALLTKSDEAVGGLEAWKKSTSRKMKGVYQTEDNSMFLAIEILQKSPNKSLSKITLPNGVMVREVCDGKSAWVETSMGGYQSFTGAALAAKLKAAEFNDRARLEMLALTGKVTGIEKVGAHTAYVLEYTPEKKTLSRVYFDADSGLIVHTEDTYTTAEGPYTVKLDLDDYRDVDGLKFPFRMKRTEKGAIVNIRLTQVIVDPPLDDTLFFKPEFAK